MAAGGAGWFHENWFHDNWFHTNWWAEFVVAATAIFTGTARPRHVGSNRGGHKFKP